MHPKLTQDCESTTINNTKNPQTLTGLLPPPPAPPQPLRTASPEPLKAQSTTILEAALLSSPWESRRLTFAEVAPLSKLAPSQIMVSEDSLVWKTLG